MGSKFALKNAQDQEFSINHLDNAGAIAINSNDISTKSQIETTIAPYNKGFKNYIINGNFDIWQRGTGFSSVGYTADRWYLATGGSANATKHNITPNTILLTTTAASSFANLYQAIETATVFGLRGKTLTLSLKIAIGGTHTGGLTLSARYSNSTDTLNNQNTLIQYLNISASPTNTRYSLTFTVPADAVGLRIDIENTSVQPSGALYQVQEVQLEEGSVATPFEDRPYGLELSLCQRYFYSYSANTGRTAPYDDEATGATGVSAGTTMCYRLSQDHPVTMRAIPTVGYSGTINMWNGSIKTSVTSILNNNSTITTRSIDYNVASAFGATPQPVKEFITQGAKILVSAEL